MPRSSSELHPIHLVVSGRGFVVLHKHCFGFIWFQFILLFITALFNFHGTQLFSACGATLLNIELAPFLEDEDETHAEYVAYIIATTTISQH